MAIDKNKLKFHKYKCFVCGTPHRHRRKNKFHEFCKKCAVAFMLKGRRLRFKLPCFGSMSCEADYPCPLQNHCAEAIFNDTKMVPPAAWNIIKEKVAAQESIKNWKKKGTK